MFCIMNYILYNYYKHYTKNMITVLYLGGAQVAWDWDQVSDIVQAQNGLQVAVKSQHKPVLWNAAKTPKVQMCIIILAEEISMISLI